MRYVFLVEGFGVIYGYVSHTSVPTLIKYLSSALAVIVTADIIRLNVPPFARFYERVLGAFMVSRRSLSRLSVSPRLHTYLPVSQQRESEKVRRICQQLTSSLSDTFPPIFT